MKYSKIREEELKNKIGDDWFKNFDTTEILGNIDFCVSNAINPRSTSDPLKGVQIFGKTPLLWAEAKTGNFDISTMFVQLILTIGKARTFDKTLPPAFLGAFDFYKIAFVPYPSIQDIFYLNDFNWNVTPSNHETKEFKLIKDRIETILKQNTYIYDYEKDEKELKFFIANNIAKATETSKIKIDKNNFVPIYLRWLETIKPIIGVDWDTLKKANILDSDFYLADLFVDDKDTPSIDDDQTIRDSLFVVFQNQGYTIAKENIHQMFDATISIKNKETYQQFWKRYKRPPITEFQDYIIERRDLLVPQDIRERKGAFFTPRIWVELSQKYLTATLGENWQDEYYIWDCAAGTGNLLAGLTNKYNIWASTLDMADVNVVHERIDHGANLLKDHVFQFDFLNDEFDKLPKGLRDIINNPEKRKKLVVYINPPYAEAGDIKQRTGTGKNKENVALANNTYLKYKDKLGKASNELFTQFFIRIEKEIQGCILAEFSKLKHLQAPNFKNFRTIFQANLMKSFIVPANTFDNVKGKFPIGFFIWDTSKQERFEKINVDIFDENSVFIGQKNIYSDDDKKGSLIEWIAQFKARTDTEIGMMNTGRNDFQNQNLVYIKNEVADKGHSIYINYNNILFSSIYLAVRHCIEATWLNDRDQFLFPNDGWETDTEFQNDCLAFTLFHGQNRITSKEGINHWIPFTETEVNVRDKFENNFMSKFMKNPCPTDIPLQGEQLEITQSPPCNGAGGLNQFPLEFSDCAKTVFNAGKELYIYYHSQPNCNVNASLYDIREHFQGRNEKGKMNNKSNDEKYMQLIGNLREKLKILGKKIQPKVYEYGFLKE